jgi:hypothetical protein
MQKYKLVGSAPTLGALKELLVKRWFWSDVEVSAVGGVSVGGKIVEGMRIIKKGPRWRLEMEIK